MFFSLYLKTIGKPLKDYALLPLNKYLDLLSPLTAPQDKKKEIFSLVVHFKLNIVECIFGLEV